MIDFLHLFGSRFELLHLLFLTGFILILCSFIKKKVVIAILCSLSCLYLLMQLISLYFVKEFIGYAFYAHFNTRDVTSMIGLYTNQIIGFTLFFVISSVVLYLIVILLNKFTANRAKLWVNLFKVFVLVTCLVMLTKQNSVFQRNYEVLSMLNVPESNFDDNLKKLGVEFYTKPSNIVSEKGKNVIVISLESFEKGFLHDSHTDLAPNLRQLKTNWNYYPMVQNTGSSWTSGSLYALMTGFPAFFGASSNYIFQGAYHSEVTSLVEVFNKADYETSFLIEDAQFSGTEDMLNAFNIDVIIDKTQLKEKVRDKDLFEEAKKIIEKKSNNEEAFAMFISTTDTHFPDGIYDERFEKIIPKKNSDYEFMVAAVDYSVGDFINFLETEKLLDNTVVFIFPDHLKMGDPAIFEGTGERELYVITNAINNDTILKDSLPINQIDLPKIILEGAEISHNTQFLTDFIPGDKNAFIEANLNLITALNQSGFQRLNYESFEMPDLSTKYKEYKIDTNRFIAHGGGLIDGYDYTNSLEAMNNSYDSGFRLFELDIIETSDGHYVAAHDWEKWRRFVGKPGDEPVSLAEFMKHKILKRYTPLGMNEINQWFIEHPNCTLITDKVNNPRDFANKFVDKNRLMMELFSEDAVLEGLSVGILSAIPSQNVVESFGNDKLDWLKNHKIKHIAISRRYINSNKDFLIELKKEDIKAFAFHLNFDAGIDEDYVVKYEMDFIYGIYADKWTFNSKVSP